VADKAQSFFIGDAAGRAGDFAATDRKWALNVGVPFFTPEASMHSPSARPRADYLHRSTSWV
jgi:bifunctional polynucleotide phosphatase/kinase